MTTVTIRIAPRDLRYGDILQAWKNRETGLTVYRRSPWQDLPPRLWHRLPYRFRIKPPRHALWLDMAADRLTPPPDDLPTPRSTDA